MLEKLLKVKPILIISLLFFTIGYTQNTVNFNHISPSINNKPIAVKKTIQDYLGNILMVCNEGILKYDGYDYYLTKKEHIFPNIKPNDAIKDIIKINDKKYWVLTKLGWLSEFNHKTGYYHNLSERVLNNTLISAIYYKNDIGWLISTTGELYRHKNKKIELITTLKSNDSHIANINDLVVNEFNNQIYLGTKNGKVFKYTTENKVLTEIVGPFTNYPGSIVLTIDDFNRLWIGTETHGLFVYDLLKKEFVQKSLLADNLQDINQELFLTLFKDSSGNIWAGTDGNGLYFINTKTGRTTIYTKKEKNSFSLSSNTVLDINEDSNNNIWVATNYGSLNIIAHTNKNINYLSGSDSDKPLRILSIYKSQDYLWIGTDGWGLTQVTFNKDGSTEKKQFFKREGQKKGFYIQSITNDNNGNLWFGTYKNGLWIYNINKNTFSQLPIYNSQNHRATDVRKVFTDSKNRIWVSSNVSLNIYNSNKQILASFEKNTKGLDGTIIESIVEDGHNNIWLGVFNSGLYKFEENQGNLNYSSFKDYTHYVKDDDFMFTAVKSMSIDSKNKLWLITGHGKFLSFDPTTNIYHDYNDFINGSEQNFNGILTDNNDEIWMTSDNGIYHFNPNNKQVKIYQLTDGLQSNTFMNRSVYKDSSNLLYFGGVKGLNYFSPTKIDKIESTAELQIQHIEILNRPIDSFPEFKKNSALTNLNTINLKNKQSSFSFKFSAIGNIINPNYFYAYRLIGFDDDWITNHSERVATYTNIPPGTYTFEVKAGTKAGVWNIPVKRFTIIIDQPWWFSIPAIIAYLLLLGIFIYLVRRWYNLKKRLFLQKIVHKKEKEVNKSKIDFFTKMSHEIQTPLTLILSPIGDMIKKATESGNLLLEEQLQIIANNATRLSKIAQNLTFIRDNEANKLKLTVSKNDLSAHLNTIKLSFKEQARQKHIDFDIQHAGDLTNIWYDKEKLEHIVYNFLSNAFKFTPNDGKILINASTIKNNSKIKISVKNSGSIIPKKELDKIFKLFYQVSKSNGTGIGLALSKELTTLHKGEIKVKSNKKNGTIFTIVIPITEDAYTEDEKIILHEQKELVNRTPPLLQNTLSKALETNKSSKTILIVEDNIELQNFLKNSLNQQYNILLADNGKEGYLKASKHTVDLIISDVMMPILDGISMCKKLQSNKATQHIPIILLTAKYSTYSKILGLESGAIEYLYKPFNTQELFLKINNILTSKEHIITEYRKGIINTPSVANEKSKDEKFLEELVYAINSKLEDSNLKVEDISKKLNMSYSTLYRKCLAITGKNVSDFIIELRLKKAAILLTKYKHTISDTAFLTGFNDPKYFSKCFKKQFNKTPRKFLKESQLIGVNKLLENYELEQI